MSRANRTNPHPHILVFPFPAQGHMLPLLDLTYQLARRGLTITILVTPKNLPLLSSLLSSHPSSITPLVLPFPSHPLIPPGTEHVKDLGNRGNLPIMAALGKLHDPLVDWFNSHSNPPVAILSDFFLGWTERLATCLQIPRITFFSSGAFLVSVADYIWNNVEKVKSLTEVEFSHLPGSPVFKQVHLPSLFKFYKRSDPDWEFIKDGMIANAKSWGCVFNSFDALENQHVQCFKTQVGHNRVFTVAPLSLTGLDVSARGNSGSDSHLNDQVLTWLNGCPDGSVVYVCFGSQKLLRKEQMEALANGLEKSGTRFIWVVKPGTTQQQDEGYAVVPNGFEKRISGRGLVIKGWAPQVLILNHKAVGGFLSHCGWNSVLEGIVGGVMILAWPMEADQHFNARLLVDDMGVGVRVCEGPDSVPGEYEDMPSDMAKSVVNSICNEDEDCVECKKRTNSDDDDDIMILDSNDIKEKFPSHKRRRDSTWEMLNWVTEIAKDPCDVVVGSLPDRSKWKAYGSEELWKQVLLFREAAFHKNDDHSSAEQSNWQKNQKMRPCMYDDQNNLGYNLRERLSCTKKVLFGKMASKGQDWSQSSSSGNHSDLDSAMIGIDKQLHGICDSAAPDSVFDYDVDIQVPIGPLFQVEVPDWTGVVSESDPKWLGTRVWPLEKKENRFLIERDRIGKGRQDSCGCPLQDSLQCVKFHVTEKRLKVKLELGSAFNKWKFDNMGEEVAFAWEEEEQKTFSSIVKSNPPSLEKCFWDSIYKYFPKKSREELVCYYYNVFLLQRRAFQNRITPTNINSDDEEAEAESKPVVKGSGHGAIKSYTSILISPKKSQKRARISSSSKDDTL